MAAKSLFNQLRFLRKVSMPSLIHKNGMSQYPNYYVNPVPRKESQEELEKAGELQQLKHIPTRAALIDQTCSLAKDDTLNLFINYVMRDGLKSLARDIVEKALEKVKRIQLEKYHKTKNEADKMKIELNPKEIFHKAVSNCKPVLYLTPIKRGGVTYQVPIPISEKRQQFISMKWLIEAAKDKERTVHFPEKLAHELIDAANNTGRVVKKKQDLHRQCEANRAYAHYRWS